MIDIKYVVAILLSASLSSVAIAEDEGEMPSPEVQCVDSDSYEDASGFWHDCPGVEIQTQGSEEEQEWSEEEEQLGDYEEGESNQEVEAD